MLMRQGRYELGAQDHDSNEQSPGSPQPVALFAGACLASPVEAADRFASPSRRPARSPWEIAADQGARTRQGRRSRHRDRRSSPRPTRARSRCKAAAADLIVSDWLWVARERALGDKLLFTPYSTALGAVMAPKESPIQTHCRSRRAFDRRRRRTARQELADAARRGRSRGARSWPRAREPSYGAPPLIAEKLAQGETEAALEFWNFAADLETRGFRRAIEMADVEKALGAKRPGGHHRLCVQRILRRRRTRTR